MPFMKPDADSELRGCGGGVCTERMKLGCSRVRHKAAPGQVHLAKDMSTRDQLSRGRIEIGVGTGGRHRMFSEFKVDPNSWWHGFFNEGADDEGAMDRAASFNFDGRFRQ